MRFEREEKFHSQHEGVCAFMHVQVDHPGFYVEAVFLPLPSNLPNLDLITEVLQKGLCHISGCLNRMISHRNSRFKTTQTLGLFSIVL